MQRKDCQGKLGQCLEFRSTSSLMPCLIQLQFDGACIRVAAGKTENLMRQESPTGLQVKANNIIKVHPSSLLSPPPQPPQLVASGGLLTALCGALDQCVAAQTSGLSCSLPQNLQLALLLSAASAGVPASLPTKGLSSASRNQVLLFYQGWLSSWMQPVLQILLRRKGVLVLCSPGRSDPCNASTGSRVYVFLLNGVVLGRYLTLWRILLMG